MRYKILKVHPIVFLEVFKHGTDKVRIVNGTIPEDAKFVRASTEDYSGWGNISLILESSSFDDLKDGDKIPVIPHPSFEKVT